MSSPPAAKSATGCGSNGTFRSRWTTGSCCAPTSTGRDDGRYPVILSSGPTARGSRSRRGTETAWDKMAPKHPEVTAGTPTDIRTSSWSTPEKWVPEGYACVRVDSRGAGRSPGYARANLAARNAGLRRMHRVGRRTTLVQRQSRAQRHFVLRHQPVPGGGAAAAVPRGDLRLGRRQRLVPRGQPPRRHPLQFLGEHVSTCRSRRSSTAPANAALGARDRRAGGRTGDAFGGMSSHGNRLRRRGRSPRSTAR